MDAINETVFRMRKFTDFSIRVWFDLYAAKRNVKYTSQKLHHTREVRGAKQTNEIVYYYGRTTRSRAARGEMSSMSMYLVFRDFHREESAPHLKNIIKLSCVSFRTGKWCT